MTGSPRSRRLALDGAVNFRDVGGYVTGDGRRVKWRVLYRSDSLAELTEADVAAVSQLGLKNVCDLRHPHEQQLKPSRGLAESVVRHNAGFYPHRAQEMLARMRSGAVSAADVEALLCEAYRRFPLDQQQRCAELLSLLQQPDALPLLIHCTSGKDRTGFAVAVVLLALGVPRQTIAEDYALSSQYRRDLRFMVGDLVAADALSAVTRADPRYLAAAFATIDEAWGGDDAFLERGLGLTPEGQARLREALLEPAAA